MNPPTTRPPTSGNASPSASGATVPYHTHPASSVEGSLPGRLDHPAQYEAHNANNMTETGWWSAHLLTANMPFSSQWACQTIRSGADTSAYFLVQIAYEVVGTYKVYRRVANVTWQSWGEIAVV